MPCLCKLGLRVMKLASCPRKTLGNTGQEGKLTRHCLLHKKMTASTKQKSGEEERKSDQTKTHHNLVLACPLGQDKSHSLESPFLCDWENTILS